jgi:hypothetical protein
MNGLPDPIIVNLDDGDLTDRQCWALSFLVFGVPTIFTAVLAVAAI